MKFLALVLGIKHANADRPCPWCLSSRIEFPVNIHDHKSFRVLEGERPEELGYKKDPIFKFVKMENIIVDILHLFLRVADKLLDVLYQYIEQLDWIAQQEKMEENKKKKERGEVIEEEEQEEEHVECGRSATYNSDSTATCDSIGLPWTHLLPGSRVEEWHPRGRLPLPCAHTTR